MAVCVLPKLTEHHAVKEEDKPLQLAQVATDPLLGWHTDSEETGCCSPSCWDDPHAEGRLHTLLLP